jgi:hypothetical protein
MCAYKLGSGYYGSGYSMDLEMDMDLDLKLGGMHLDLDSDLALGLGNISYGSHGEDDPYTRRTIGETNF